MLILRVFWAEFRKSLILFMRYPFGSLITVSVMLLLFIGIFETALRVSSVEELSSDQTRLAAQKFVLWTVMILGFSSVAASIKDETQSGFIEVVWMGALHPTIVVFIRSLVSHTISISMCMLIALLLSVFYQVQSFFSLRFMFATVNISIVSVGFSLILSAGLVIFKEIGPLVSLLQFILLPVFLAFDAQAGSVASVLPGYSALLVLECLDCKANHSLSFLYQISPFFWLALGCICQLWGVKYSRKKGTIYEY